ncbi:MAG: STAS domain-containing protein [bacterium]|nr:STAS domain-containing protein [Candidatus Sumerlaeota bacterium]
MNIIESIQDGITILRLEGRFDAFEAKSFMDTIRSKSSDLPMSIVLDMSVVNYLSSGGLRAILTLYKSQRERGMAFALACLQPYCGQVLRIAGFADTLNVFETQQDAVAHCRNLMHDKIMAEQWDNLSTYDIEHGRVRIIPGSDQPGAIEVMGHVNDVLFSRITPAHLCSKRFSETEFSIGLGGLGDRVKDYIGIMGEMITIGGTMVWLPTDGHDTPDYLIPRADHGEVTLRTGFNVSVAGGFNKFFHYKSADAEGITIGELYRNLFNYARQFHPEFKGALALAIRAQMPAVFGAGIKHSPIAENAPGDGGMITAPQHFTEWFESDSAPRHENVTGLIVGMGIDLTGTLSHYDEKQLGAVFYINPAQKQSQKQMLHNHVVLFNRQPFTDHPVNLDWEIRRVVDDGDFIDMRHLLDNSRLNEALVGVNFVQQFRPDPHGRQGM